MHDKDLVPPKLLIILELLPSCGMSFYKAALRVGYSDSYARKISSKFADDKRLQKALRDRIKRLLAEADESDRLVLERLLQRQHFDAHPICGMYLTGRSPFVTELEPTFVPGAGRRGGLDRQLAPKSFKYRPVTADLTES